MSGVVKDEAEGAVDAMILLFEALRLTHDLAVGGTSAHTRNAAGAGIDPDKVSGVVEEEAEVHLALVDAMIFLLEVLQLALATLLA